MITFPEMNKKNIIIGLFIMFSLLMVIAVYYDAYKSVGAGFGEAENEGSEAGSEDQE